MRRAGLVVAATRASPRAGRTTRRAPPPRRSRRRTAVDTAPTAEPPETSIDGRDDDGRSRPTTPSRRTRPMRRRRPTRRRRPRRSRRRPRSPRRRRPAAPVLNGLDPACADVPAAGGCRPIARDPRHVRTARASSRPCRSSCRRPRSESDPNIAVARSAAGAPVEAGLLLGVRAPFGEFEGSQLSLVGWDGTTRWVRCVDETLRCWFASPAAEPVLARAHGITGDVRPPRGTRSSVATGDDQPDDVADRRRCVAVRLEPATSPCSERPPERPIDPATDLL